MKNIVVLDAHTLSPLQPGEHSPFHPHWDAIAALGPLQLYPRSKPDEVIARAQNAEILLTNKAVVNADHINALPNLEYIGVMATGYNVVDLDAARARGISVTNIPGYGTASVAQHVFALLLELAARVGATDAAVKNGDWVRCPDFCFTVSPFVELAGKTLGIVGYGTIGQAVARIASAFGMRILATARTPKPSDVPVEWVSRDELFRQSDVITLHCPLTDETRHVINRDNLAKMKSSAFLINTGRGPLIDEEALAGALKDGVIAGFGGDVLSSEPPSRTNPLLSAPRTIITPHIAWASVEARTRLMGILAKNILDFLAGTPANVVNGLAAASSAVAVAASEESAPQAPAIQEASVQEPTPEEPAAAKAEEAVPQESVTAETSSASLELEAASSEPSQPHAEGVPSSEAETESQPSEPAGDFVPVEPHAQELIPSNSPASPEPVSGETDWEEHGLPEPTSSEPPKTIPQEAVAEALAATDSTTPETTPEFPVQEKTFPGQPFVPEAVPADAIPHEFAPPDLGGQEAAPLAVPQEPQPDPIPQEALAESLAAADSTTPETALEIAAQDETVPTQLSAPKVVPAGTVPSGSSEAEPEVGIPEQASAAEPLPVAENSVEILSPEPVLQTAEENSFEEAPKSINPDTEVSEASPEAAPDLEPGHPEAAEKTSLSAPESSEPVLLDTEENLLQEPANAEEAVADVPPEGDKSERPPSCG